MSDDAPPVEKVDHYAKCYDCDRKLSARATVRVPVHVDKPDGGYDRVDMPMCRHCRLKRHGHECDHCGQLHETMNAAYTCCVGTSKAPDCRQCGRRMSVGSAGYSEHTGMTIDWAECECCPIAWGRFTGWELLDGEEPCEHVDGDQQGGAA